MLTSDQRLLVMSHFRAGRSVSQILPFFTEICKRSTLYTLKKEFDRGIEAKTKTRQKHPWKKISPKMAATIIRRLTINNRQHSVRSVAKDFSVSKTAVQKLLDRKGIRCYKKVKRNLIPKSQEDKRRICCARFRKAFRKSDLEDMLFVDECYFTVGTSFNHQNERCYGKDFQAVPNRKKFKQMPKTPLSAMVFAGVSREGRTPLVVLKSGFRLNQHTYKDKCIDIVRTSLPHPLKPDSVIFYQDKAPCHAAKSVQSYLAAIFPCFVPNHAMPPNSPDLNVLDFCVWNLLKERLNKYGLISNFEKLKKLLKKEWDAIPQQVIKDAVDSWLIRVRKVEKSGGAHIE